MTLRAYAGDDFEMLFKTLQRQLTEAPIISTGQWQSKDISDIPLMQTPELQNVSFSMKLPQSADQLADLTGAHLPWAEDHFQERVGGEPLNPSPSEEWWPFAQKVNKEHKSEEGSAFSHTYPERIWPKWAGPAYADMKDSNSVAWEPMHGVRFDYGDLDDVVNQLLVGPLTRQAFLPIWFPEDTGATLGRRVPCTLGYHFMIREGGLTITYYMRSCDLIRHFQDDVYMAGRLAQWMVHELNTRVPSSDAPAQVYSLKVNELVMHIASLHCFQGDLAMMKYRTGKDLAWTV
jgi:hypothetical protein